MMYDNIFESVWQVCAGEGQVFPLCSVGPEQARDRPSPYAAGPE